MLSQLTWRLQSVASLTLDRPCFPSIERQSHHHDGHHGHDGRRDDLRHGGHDGGDGDVRDVLRVSLNHLP